MLETKFYLALKVLSEKMAGSVDHLIQVFVDSDKSALLVKVTNPVTSEVHSLKYTEDVSDLLPKWKVKGGSWEKLIAGSRGWAQAQGFSNPRGSVLRPFNCMQNPNEEGAMVRFTNRLNLLNVNNVTTLTTSEQSKFVDHLRTLFQCATLPFFVTVNELCLSFVIDLQTTKKFGSINKVGERSERALRNTSKLAMDREPNRTEPKWLQELWLHSLLNCPTHFVWLAWFARRRQFFSPSKRTGSSTPSCAIPLAC